MEALVHPHLAPNVCLEQEPAQAKGLVWLPLALRYKLDATRLRISLRDWQRLPLECRLALLQAPLDPGTSGFRSRAVTAGARRDSTAGACEANDVVESFSTYAIRKLTATRAAHPEP